jgi:hypothetical protein
MTSTTNRNRRGGSAQRRIRRAWLLAHYGDGKTAPCYRCAVPLTEETITADRIFPGCLGGTYRRGNIRPCCNPCNMETGGQLGSARRGVRSLPVQLTAIADLVAEFAEVLAEFDGEEIGPRHRCIAAEAVGQALHRLHPGHRMPAERTITTAIIRRTAA